jgi:hypothetical protein
VRDSCFFFWSHNTSPCAIGCIELLELVRILQYTLTALPAVNAPGIALLDTDTGTGAGNLRSEVPCHTKAIQGPVDVNERHILQASNADKHGGLSRWGCGAAAKALQVMIR